MNIQEATKLAMEKSTPMTRKSEYFVGVVFPTNSSRYQCIIGQERYRERQTALGRWQPSADDLLADDWVLEDEIF